MEYSFVPSENKKIFIINKRVQAVLLAVLLLSGGQLNAHQVNDDWCWCLAENIVSSDLHGDERIAGKFFPANSRDVINYTFRFIQVSRCGSAYSKQYFSADFGARLYRRPQKPVQVAYNTCDGCVKYLYYAYMESFFFQTFTPERKARLLREEPCLNYSNDLFDSDARKVWRQILSFWEQPEKGRELLGQPYSTTFKIADYVLGFSPSSDVYRFPRSYAVSPDICQSEEEFVLGNPVEAGALASQLGELKIGQVWFLEEPGEPSAGIYNRYHLCVVYIGGGIFLLPISQEKQHFLNINDFLVLIRNASQFDGKYQWRGAMIRTSNGKKPFSLKMQEAYPLSVTDFLYKEVER